MYKFLKSIWYMDVHLLSPKAFLLKVCFCFVFKINLNTVWELVRNSEFHPRFSESELGFLSGFHRRWVSHWSLRSSHWPKKGHVQFYSVMQMFYTWWKMQEIRFPLYFTIMWIKSVPLDYTNSVYHDHKY